MTREPVVAAEQINVSCNLNPNLLATLHRKGWLRVGIIWFSERYGAFACTRLQLGKQLGIRFQPNSQQSSSVSQILSQSRKGFVEAILSNIITVLLNLYLSLAAFPWFHRPDALNTSSSWSASWVTEESHWRAHQMSTRRRQVLAANEMRCTVPSLYNRTVLVRSGTPTPQSCWWGQEVWRIYWGQQTCNDLLRHSHCVCGSFFHHYQLYRMFHHVRPLSSIFKSSCVIGFHFATLHPPTSHHCPFPGLQPGGSPAPGATGPSRPVFTKQWPAGKQVKSRWKQYISGHIWACWMNSTPFCQGIMHSFHCGRKPKGSFLFRPIWWGPRWP